MGGGEAVGFARRNMQTTKNMKNINFPHWQEKDWIEKSEQSLKGKKIEKLSTDTYENIKLKPLYFKSEQECSQYPGVPDFRRGIEAAPCDQQSWRIAQCLTATSEEELIKKIKTAIQSGQTAISFSPQKHYSYESLFTTFVKDHHYSVDADTYQLQLLTRLSSVSGSEQAQGFIAADPLAKLATDGFLEKSIEENYDILANNIQYASDKLPQLRTILVDTTPYHNGGANAVQELAISLATAVFHIEELLKRNVPLQTLLSKLVFQYSIGSNFYMEIAKIRAARMLWSQIAKAYGGSASNQKMVISARTSSFTKTMYDPYVNILRAGNEAFAAAVAGVQYLHVSPFNEPEGQGTSFSERIARNTQLILKEEAFLTKTSDPAGGSWYIEELTDNIAHKAWELFLQIDESGGILASLQKGEVQAQVASIMEKRKQDIFTRKQTIIGTNMYANLNDQPLKVTKDQQTSPSSAAIIIQAIPQNRLADPYEKLRAYSEKQTHQPTIGLICLGKMKEFKPRADFIVGFLSPGGIKAEWSDDIENFESIKKFIQETNYSTYCLCASDEKYEQDGYAWAQEMKALFPNKRLYMAGQPLHKEKWMALGISDFIHSRSNCFETLSSLLMEMEETTHA